MLLFLTTLIASLILGVEYGILIGIAVNLVILLYFTARPPISMEERPLIGNTGPVFMVTPGQRLHFPAAEYLREKVIEKCPTDGDVVVDGRRVADIDVTVAKVSYIFNYPKYT